jgi:hypothetical protein
MLFSITPRLVLAGLFLWMAGVPAAAAPPAPEEGSLLAAYTLLGEDGRVVLRAIVDGPQCPSLTVDGRTLTMGERAGPRTPASGPRGAAFAVRSCERALESPAHHARLGSRVLPLPGRSLRRLLVIGDTGCRQKALQAPAALPVLAPVSAQIGIFQNCDDAGAWPFAGLAARAAAEQPDLVVHVGDYHYRESACPPGRTCAHGPWGYGWDAWNADFFSPAAPLLLAAPWVMTRGNHEECARAGQGWYRFLAPDPLREGRDCDNPQADEVADYSPPYAVPLGDNWQLVVFDSASASSGAKPGSAAYQQRREHLRAQYHRAAELAAVPGRHTIFVSHHPVFGYTLELGGIAVGNGVMLDALEDPGARGPGPMLPAGVELALHGHVHDFQAVDFRSGQPATLVAGHGGDALDRDFPPHLSPSERERPGLAVRHVTEAVRFGYLVLERAEPGGWNLRAMGLDGATMVRCQVAGGHVSCPDDGAMGRDPAAP